MTEKEFNIVVLGGDGIGPEVTQQATRLLKEIESRLTSVSFRLDKHSAGVGEYLKNGKGLPDSTFEACQRSDAILMGAMGLPNVRYPDGTEISPQIELREQLELFGGVRPIRLFHENDTPLKGYGPGGFDFVLVRESTEGLFSGRGGTTDKEVGEATNVMKITRRGAERVSRLAFELARKRNGKKKVTLIDKANVLSALFYFREIFDEVAADYSDIEAEHMYVDASALFMVRCPDRFDVMVTENMYGDILSDLGAGLVGGMGMAPSGDIGVNAAVFQPSHGSAPDISGQGIANPIAMILSTAMMLDWLDHEETKKAAKQLDVAVAQVLVDPNNRTPDMGGKMSTEQMTDLISQKLTESNL